MRNGRAGMPELALDQPNSIAGPRQAIGGAGANGLSLLGQRRLSVR